MENLFPFVIISDSKNKNLKDFFKNYNDVLFCDFENDFYFIPKNLQNCISKDIFEEIFFDLENYVFDQKIEFYHFYFIFHFFLIFKKYLYTFLNKTIFCYKIYDIRKDTNFNLKDIFNFEKFLKLMSNDVNKLFFQIFSETSLFSKFIEDSNENFYQLYKEAKLNNKTKNKVFPFLKKIVNSYKIMPSKKLKRKTFFENNNSIFSYFEIEKEEIKDFENFIKTLKKENFSLENYFQNYQINLCFLNKKNNFSLTDIKSDNGSTKGENSNFSLRNDKKKISKIFGKNYFRKFLKNQIIDFYLSPLQYELKNILNIF